MTQDVGRPIEQIIARVNGFLTGSNRKCLTKIVLIMLPTGLFLLCMRRVFSKQE